jgi:hypothetical protein
VLGEHQKAFDTAAEAVRLDQDDYEPLRLQGNAAALLHDDDAAFMLFLVAQSKCKDRRMRRVLQESIDALNLRGRRAVGPCTLL